MNIDDYYPGRLIANLSVVRKTEDEEGFLLEKAEESENKCQFYISEHHVDKKHKFKTGAIIHGPFIMLGQIDDTVYEIAKTDYHSRLRGLTLSDTSRIPWKKLWNSAFNEDLKCKGQTRLANDYEWEVRLPHAVVPIKASPYVRVMFGEHYFFPCDMRGSLDMAVYRPQSPSVRWPAKFHCEIETKQSNGARTKRNAFILIHGTLNPLKLHYNIRKHLAGDPSAGSYPNARPQWNKWSGTSIDEDFLNHFSDCPNPFADQHQCPNNCKKPHFKQTNLKMLEENDLYLRKAVTALPECASIDIEINDIKTDDMAEFEMVGCNIKGNVSAWLILRGYSYDWSEPEPRVHLHIVTFYPGKTRIKNKTTSFANGSPGQITKISPIK